ncbi:MAG: glycosyltransferase, partial [Acidobacteriota bacterium]
MPPSTQDAARSLSVVVPAYNEIGRIGRSLKDIAAYISSVGLDAEILVVDDGSSDGTAELARSLLDRTDVPHRVLTGRRNRGKGYTVREGALAAEKDWILITDADLSTPIAQVQKLWEAAEDGELDLVMGSRALPGSRIGVQQSRLRSSMGRIFNLLVHRFTGLPMRDTQCGFKLWRNKPLRPVLS